VCLRRARDFTYASEKRDMIVKQQNMVELYNLDDAEGVYASSESDFLCSG
jgi:hypothetical protein